MILDEQPMTSITPHGHLLHLPGCEMRLPLLPAHQESLDSKPPLQQIQPPIEQPKSEHELDLRTVDSQPHLDAHRTTVVMTSCHNAHAPPTASISPNPTTRRVIAWLTVSIVIAPSVLTFCVYRVCRSLRSLSFHVWRNYYSNLGAMISSI